ncbi:hypothetical protein JTE90_010765 [Oedothorax gibbosus]|uniref:Uncharacterized protein n=1 Tax=Oedothorax gibbosus TaxID=931172 RepID=A0AAV6TXY2_9ARAC|nr:hypothetical protein JTE90_010765 [Oedothorax gibbosus]
MSRVWSLVFDTDVALGISPTIQRLSALQVSVFTSRDARHQYFCWYRLKTCLLWSPTRLKNVQQFCNTSSFRRIKDLTGGPCELLERLVRHFSKTTKSGIEGAFQVTGQGNYANGNCSTHVRGIVHRWGLRLKATVLHFSKLQCEGTVYTKTLRNTLISLHLPASKSLQLLSLIVFGAGLN